MGVFVAIVLFMVMVSIVAFSTGGIFGFVIGLFFATFPVCVIVVAVYTTSEKSKKRKEEEEKLSKMTEEEKKLNFRCQQPQ